MHVVFLCFEVSVLTVRVLCLVFCASFVFFVGCRILQVLVLSYDWRRVVCVSRERNERQRMLFKSSRFLVCS